MKQGLQLRLSQQLAMTPQLQQAIRLLQLSTLELQQEIQLALESNPLLEQTDQHDEIESFEKADSDSLDTGEALEQRDMPEELPLDATWDEIYSAGTPSGTGTDYRDEELPIYQGETTQTLQDYLMWQVELTPFSDTDAAIATSIVDAVDNTGYLTVPLQDILESIGDDDVTLEEVEAVLKRVQRFDPVGVAARDLRDCLLVQLSQFADDTPRLTEARLIVSDHLDLLANHDFRSLIRITRLKEEVLKEALALIQSLDPRPGQSINTGESEYVIPDVLVRKVQGIWSVELNTDSVPRLQINQQYAALGNSARNDSDGQFIRSNLQEARWLIKSLESRNDTLLKVTRCIVEQQQDFFEQGEEFMKPMVLADIAQAVDMHESTISRVTTQKFLHSPRGIFELKYFFSSHVNTDSGGEASSTAIRALVKKLIAAENPVKPLSDSKLTALLSDQGIIVARRTVAKYRESLSIPPSNQRKQLV
ncbi:MULTISPECIES: RNA polymerase factor sigma-54 [Pectobacterium]|uniref:RNA polymerase sigma-54 factor n=1 Tax=Pectobacterium carotovorum subsp. carotovorum TaxID=555 RepID=A0AA40J6D4_PECCC|nr:MULTISPECIES: RNA polymerase factor sigma-54 [Pectobacterium]AVT56994.1 RNA polymerase factor sigma-54 [Pectobacterium versatile]KAA3667824.1 RNA polymerase factor sigma-54 [Pectobacterium carotovorum subsp. carotovorum]KFX01905.1 RNA polymerase factor sigma-54 [Pectobacterium carotovorum subsp. carotovorum]KHT14393.1 RNA polymerase factor sigma-54 [Pectobacterium carotovorum subsp. carotovorum]KHT26460.1 RNA polymerase factor sigma-54 [Pectobacterium carotovorum subsp. carotovorum]